MHQEHDEKHQYQAGHEVHIHLPHNALQRELVTHLPLSVGSVAIGLVLAGLICFLTPDSGELLHGSTEQAVVDDDHGHDHDHDHDHGHDEHDHSAGFLPLFHLFHPMHMFFSAAATTAMFRRYDRRIGRAMMVGLAGAIVVCGVSDILVPHASLYVLDKHLPLHVCVVEHPALVLPFAAIGVAIGLLAAVGVSQSTFFSHSLHVFASTMASLFYMIHAYGRLAWIDELGYMFFFVIVAVMVPCCISDIIFPVAMSKPARKAYAGSSCCH